MCKQQRLRSIHMFSPLPGKSIEDWRILSKPPKWGGFLSTIYWIVATEMHLLVVLEGCQDYWMSPTTARVGGSFFSDEKLFSRLSVSFLSDLASGNLCSWLDNLPKILDTCMKLWISQVIWFPMVFWFPSLQHQLSRSHGSIWPPDSMPPSVEGDVGARWQGAGHPWDIAVILHLEEPLWSVP
jgi:hypothetical protein